MKAGVKRKFCSSEPAHAKVAKQDSQYFAGTPVTLSPTKKMSTPSKQNPQNMASPRKHSFKIRSQEADYPSHGAEVFHSPMSSPFQSDIDTELGLIITLDEENDEKPEQERKKSEEKVKKGKRKNNESEISSAEGSSLDEDSEEEFRKLDRDLAMKSKQHNLTSVHVRNIIHEVITNEHVVAMMKAAIKETQNMPMFEPKMTRSKLKEVVEKGVGIPNWNISPIKKSKETKPPQFVDIPLEEEEDSSDEEYYPNEDDEDETAEETIPESDMESIASSPRISRRGRSCTPVQLSECEEEKNSSPRTKFNLPRHLRVEAVPMGPPAPPSCGSSHPTKALDSFIEKLHAVDEELDLNRLCMEPYQSSGEDAEVSLVACRTRSKRPLRDVPLDQLEAELQAPDITPDMYDCGLALEDKEWSQWLQGLMTSHPDNEEESDDDDPEYNFLDDLDEPDLEDYRNDKAVRITKKEVNELMEELFETLQVETGMNEDGEGVEESKSSQNVAKFNVPQAIRFEEPLAFMLTACRQTVREQLDALQQRRENVGRLNHHVPEPAMLLMPTPCSLVVTPTQKQQLKQQVQQHIQLLTQMNMLCNNLETLQNHVRTTKHFLTELQSFAERAEQVRAVVDPGFKSAFRVWNLQLSLDLLVELEKMPPSTVTLAKGKQPHTVHPYPLLSPDLAWLFATRSVFLYPELLPHCSLDPRLQPSRIKNIYTKGEDGLIVLGLKHFSETEFPYHLMSQYLIQPKRLEQLRARVKDMCSSRASDNIIKFFCKHHIVPHLPVACYPVKRGEERPPVEREVNVMPNWLQKSLPYIHNAVFGNQTVKSTSDTGTNAALSTPIFPRTTQYPQSLPKGVILQLHPSARRPTTVRASKPRPLYGFTSISSTPLAKAPVCSTGTVNLVPSVTAPLSTQGVILLTPSPFLPVSEHLASAQLTATPSHGTVPSDNVGPVNFQYVVPQLGCVNPVEPSASLPTAAVKIASTPNIVCNSAIPATGVGSKCVMQSVQKKSAMTKKQSMPRKLLPIQPNLAELTSPTPINLVSRAPAVDTLATADKEHVSNTSAPVLVIQPSALLSTSYVHQQGLFKSSITPPCQNFVQTISGSLNPSLCDIVTKEKTNKEKAESEVKSNPVYLVHTPSPPHVNPRLELSHPAQLVDSQVKQKPKCDAPVSIQKNTSLNSEQLENSPRSGNQHPGFLAHGCHTKASLPHTYSSYSHSALIDPLVDNSQYVLVQTASQSGVPQFLLMSKSSVTQQSMLHSDVSGQNTALSKSDTSQTVSVADIRKGQKTFKVGLPTNTSQNQVTSLSTEIHNEPSNEEDDAGVNVVREEMASALLGSPLLMLSESSCSPHSILSESSCADCGHPHENDNEKSSASNSPSNIAGQSSSDGDLQKIPGIITLTSGAENQKQPGGGEENGGEGKEEGSDRQNREHGQGGDEKNFGEDGQKQGDGESSGERDGQKERDGNGGKDHNNEEKDGDGEREEEEEDFDELTQDEDEEEVMSSASEESVLSVPELQETMEKLTWLASERRLCTEGESEEDNSPASPTSPISQNSQEENSEDEEDGAMKGEEMEPVDGEVEKLREEDVPQEDDPPQTSGKGAGRGRGRGRPPPRSLRKSKRQERGSKDTSKLLLLYDDHILENDPLRESKDIAFAQAYLNRVREALQDTPSKIEEFLSLLYEFEQGTEGRSAVELFSQLKPLLKEWPDLLRDFAAFLLPEQALECGLFEEQQAFERSRRFLRQLEISFGENPSHYQRIVKALQTATAITPASIEELKVQMATLLKGHTHLQGEFSVFFDELRPPPARPGQFEEAVWPEDGGSTPEGGDVINLTGGGGLSSGFEEVTLPDLEEEEELSKIPQITGKSRKRKKMGTHRNYKDCDWPEKECLCQCHFSSHDAKHRRHKRKGCSSCSVMKEIPDVSKSFKSADRSFSQVDTLREHGEEKDYSEKGGDDAEEVKNESGSRATSPIREEPEGQVWEGSEGDPPTNLEERDEEEEDMEWKEGGKEHCFTPRRDDEGLSVVHAETAFLPPPSQREMGQQSRQSPSTEAPVCAKNISLTPSGERVVLWTREADRVILTACQQQGANQSTFQSVSAQLGNKTASEVSKRFRDLMRLFHTSARQTSSEDEATEQQSATDDEQD